MSRLVSLSISLALLLASFPLVSVGTTRGPEPLTWLGIGALVLGGLIPPARRLVSRPAPEPPPTDCGLCDDDRVS